MSFQINALPPNARAAQVPLEKLEFSSQCSPSEKLAEVSRQFEAILLRQIFSEAQKPVFQSKYSAPSVAGDIYKDLITNELADQVSRSGSLGLAARLKTELQSQVKGGEDSATALEAAPPAGHRPHSHRIP